MPRQGRTTVPPPTPRVLPGMLPANQDIRRTLSVAWLLRPTGIGLLNRRSEVRILPGVLPPVSASTRPGASTPDRSRGLRLLDGGSYVEPITSESDRFRPGTSPS